MLEWRTPGVYEWTKPEEPVPVKIRVPKTPKKSDGNLRHSHRMTIKSPTYHSWTSMKNRCSNPKAAGFHLYGGRGIKVCERWNQFENFLEDMGERPAGKSLDRRQGDGDYTPDNCRWATPLEQTLNTKRVGKNG